MKSIFCLCRRNVVAKETFYISFGYGQFHQGKKCLMDALNPLECLRRNLLTKKKFFSRILGLSLGSAYVHLNAFPKKPCQIRRSDMSELVI